MKISENFNSDEFACRCQCGFDEIDPTLVEDLEELRTWAVKNYGPHYIKITSGCRCVAHNKKVGGALFSLHTIGHAADFKIVNVRTRMILNPKIVYEYLEQKYPDSCGIGLYSNRVHFDIRDNKARWEG